MSSAIEPVIEPAIVLAAYAEPVAAGRRVLFVGAASSALPSRLLERGARVVLVCDPDPVRLAEATAKNRSSAVSFSALGEGQLALRDGAFDVAIVEDATISDPVTLIKRLRRALGPRGVAIVASRNPEAGAPLLPHRTGGSVALDYYALYDAVKTEFQHVRMLGQAPFVGYVVADFAPEGAPEPSLDTAFLPNGAEEPETFIAVASQHPVELESFAVVQLPYLSVRSGATGDSEALRRARSTETATREKLAETEAQLGAERQAVAARARELQLEREAVAARTAELASERQTAAPRETKLREAETKLRENETKLRENETKFREAETKFREAEAKLRESGTKLREAETKLRENETKFREAETKLRESGTRLREAEIKLRENDTLVLARDADLTALRKELEQKTRFVEAQERKLGELNQKLTQAPSPEEVGTATAELAALEQALAERGEHVRQLERQLREAERIGKELVRQLPIAAEATGADRRESEAELAQKLAKTQADLVATRWALEAAIKRGSSSDPATA